MDQVLTRGSEHVEVEDLLGAGRLDVMRLARWNEDERPGPDLMTDAVHVVDRRAFDDRRDLVEVLVHVREDLHPGRELVHHEKCAVVAETAPPHAIAHELVGYVVPPRGDDLSRRRDGRGSA